MLAQPTQFLSCDWGTSSFRLRLVALPGLEVLASYQGGEGIGPTWRAWQAVGGDRLSFYRQVIAGGIQQLACSSGYGVQELPLVLSGMATATIGMMELPYAPLPFPADGSLAQVLHLPAGTAFPHPCLLLSGVRSDTDVMRGEETQLVGALAGDSGDQFCIIPGTHSKHIQVQAGVLTHFATYMTGEFFELLSQHSILAASVEPGNERQEGSQAFVAGLQAGHRSNLLQACFSVRTNQLFGTWHKTENYQYLSGLLVGAELAALHKSLPATVTLVGTAAQAETYRYALSCLFPGQAVRVVDGDQALIKGQAILLERHFRIAGG